MSRRDERTNGYMGIILDGEKLAKIAKVIYSAQYKEVSDFTIDNLLLIELKETDVFGNSKHAVVCTEGVGWEQDDYGTIAVPTNIGQLGLYNGRVHISIDVIKDCVTDETQDIADYIRVFGDRLDRNVSIWQSHMKDPVNA